jgi:hypothetical protein
MRTQNARFWMPFYPRGFVEGVIRWNIRVTAYRLTVVTDRYPPFRLAP